MTRGVPKSPPAAVAAADALEDWPLDDAEFPVAKLGGDPRTFRWGIAAAREILRRTLAGESLCSICRDPAMPSTNSVCRWARERPAFAAALEAARVAAGHGRPGARSTFCEETAQAIFERVCGGEALTAVCQDPAMPVMATVWAWRAKHAEFGTAMKAAFELRAEHLYEQGWEIAQGVTPETAYATEVKLRHLRWHVGKMAPKKYGTLKAQDPNGGREGPQTVIHTWVKKYVYATPEEAARGESGRWSEEPSVHLDSMVSVGDPSPLAGAKLPPPDVVREPATCRGPNPTRAPAGGAVECEVEDAESAEREVEDYWAGPGWRGA